MPLGDLTQAWVRASAALPLEWVFVGVWLDPNRPGEWQAVARGPVDPVEIVTGYGMQGDMLFDYISRVDVEELQRMLRMRALGAKDVILAEIDRRKTQELNRRLLVLAQITSGAAIFTIFLALAIALQWGRSDSQVDSLEGRQT